MGIGGEKGSGAMDVVIASAIIVLLVFPVFSTVIEKYIIIAKSQVIKDAVDMTNVSAYNALNSVNLAKADIEMNNEDIRMIFARLLAKNLNLEPDLSPKENSLAENRVIVDSVEIYTEEFPATCPNGTQIRRPSVHSCIIVPIKPAMYRQIILNALGKQHIELKVHVDSDIPVNN